MDPAPKPPTHTNDAAPYCGNCGYNLEGLTESSRCPECGRPFVEVLQRPSLIIGKRFNSRTRVFGLPLISIASGPHGKEKRGHAKGIIAIGDIATGFVAFGGVSRGIFTFGGFSIGAVSFGGVTLGLLLALGGLAIGGVTTGGFGIGGYANGGMACGFIAEGGMAMGYYARGGSAIGKFVVSPSQQDPEARSVFRATELTINGRPMRVFSKITVYALIAAFVLAILLFLIVLFNARGNQAESGAS
jgi:hypothetical protein